MQPWKHASTMGEVLDAHCSQRPEKVALIDSHRRSTTFAQLNERVNRLCNALMARGIRTGDRIAILSYNRLEYLEIFAMSKMGLVIVPLNWRLTSAELQSLLRHSRAKAIVVEDIFASITNELCAEVRTISTRIMIGNNQPGWLAYEALATEGSDLELTRRASKDDVLCIVYTSGTTGDPKGVKITHRSALDNCRTSADEMLALTENDRTLAVLPLFHVGGMWYHLFPSFATGCTNVIMSHFEPNAVLQAVQDHHITNVHLVPTMIASLLNHPRIGTFDLRHLRLIFYAASSMPLEILRNALRAFPHCSFAQGYGSTEAGTVTGLLPEHHILAQQPAHEHLLSSCGQALTGREIRILDPNNQDVSVGTIGELVVRSAGNMAGYWDNDGMTKATVQDGWVYTGDLARQDEQGYYYIVDRKNDMIITGGENVYPTEVESFFYTDPQVQEAAVFGIPDPQWVEKVVAAVVLKPGAQATPETLIQHLRARLAAYKCPKKIYVVPSLPKNGAGKVLRKTLRLEYSEQ